MADRNKFIKIINISLNYQEISTFNIGKSIGFISSCLLLINEKLLIISIFGKKKDDYTKVYSVNEIFNQTIIKNDKSNNISLLKKLPGTNNIVVLSLLYWESNNNKYLIQLSNNKIIINDIYKYNLYGILETNESNKDNMLYSGCIYDYHYLIAISHEGSIFSWNLNSKCLINKINIKTLTFCDCLLWSNNYLIITSRNQKNNNIILTLEISQFKIINKMQIKGIEGIIGIKKIIHPELGNCLLISGENNKIMMLSI